MRPTRSTSPKPRLARDLSTGTATSIKQERRTFWSCKIGYGLDGMDTQMLSFVVPTLIAMWGITTGEAGLIHTSTLIASAIGGWVAGILSDRIGRVRTLQLTVLWFAFFTFLCGFAQNYEQLLISRTLMGFGFGGEWTAGAVLMGEVIRAKDRGKAVGMVQSGWALGWGLTAILYALLFSVLPPEDAWRALFILGIVPAIFVIFVRRLVKDPEIYREAKAKAGTQQSGKVLRDLRSRHPFHHDSRFGADHRCSGRLLRDHLLVADFSEERTRFERTRYGRLSGDGDRRFLRRLCHQRVFD